MTDMRLHTATSFGIMKHMTLKQKQVYDSRYYHRHYEQ